MTRRGTPCRSHGKSTEYSRIAKRRKPEHQVSGQGHRILPSGESRNGQGAASWERGRLALGKENEGETPSLPWRVRAIRLLPPRILPRPSLSASRLDKAEGRRPTVVLSTRSVAVFASWRCCASLATIPGRRFTCPGYAGCPWVAKNQMRWLCVSGALVERSSVHQNHSVMWSAHKKIPPPASTQQLSCARATTRDAFCHTSRREPRSHGACAANARRALLEY
jgi:hypothetical protein